MPKKRTLAERAMDAARDFAKQNPDRPVSAETLDLLRRQMPGFMAGWVVGYRAAQREKKGKRG